MVYADLSGAHVPVVSSSQQHAAELQLAMACCTAAQHAAATSAGLLPEKDDAASIRDGNVTPCTSKTYCKGAHRRVMTNCSSAALDPLRWQLRGLQLPPGPGRSLHSWLVPTYVLNKLKADGRATAVLQGSNL
jgi:hypothetical protein